MFLSLCSHSLMLDYGTSAAFSNGVSAEPEPSRRPLEKAVKAAGLSGATLTETEVVMDAFLWIRELIEISEKLSILYVFHHMRKTKGSK